MCTTILRCRKQNLRFGKDLHPLSTVVCVDGKLFARMTQFRMISRECVKFISYLSLSTSIPCPLSLSRTCIHMYTHKHTHTHVHIHTHALTLTNIYWHSDSHTPRATFQKSEDEGQSSQTHLPSSSIPRCLPPPLPHSTS